MYNWGRSAPSLYTLSLDYVMNNLRIYSNDCDLQNCLPLKIKDQILRRLTKNAIFVKQLDLKKTVKLMAHSRIEMIDLTSVCVDDELLQILEICEGLKKVYLSTDGIDNITRFGLMNFLKCLPCLQFLELRHCDVVDDMVVECISEYCHKLRALDLGGCSKITDIGLNSLGHLNGITCLSLSKTQITNEGLKKFIQRPSGKHLEELKIDNCQNINLTGLMAVTKYCPKLKILIFHNCGMSAEEIMLFMEEKSLDKIQQVTLSITW